MKRIDEKWIKKHMDRLWIQWWNENGKPTTVKLVIDMLRAQNRHMQAMEFMDWIFFTMIDNYVLIDYSRQCVRLALLNRDNENQIPVYERMIAMGMQIINKNRIK